MTTGKEAVLIINDSLKRKKGTFVLAKENGTNMLFTGAPTAARSENGYVIALGLSREQVVKLRDMCEAALEEES